MKSQPNGSAFFEGESIQVRRLDENFVEMCFDRRDGSTNKLDARTIAEIRMVLALLAAEPQTRGMLLASGKEVFVVGADVNEFIARFSLDEMALVDEVRSASDVFRSLEDLPFPTVAAINGYALGGGLELALACSFRVMSSTSVVGLPEVKLGLIPGAGGHVRLPRLAGLAVALQWITEGQSFMADDALDANVVDDVCRPEDLREVAVGMLRQAASGDLDWKAQLKKKIEPLACDAAAHAKAYGEALAARGIDVAGSSAQSAVSSLLVRCAVLDRDVAMEEELRTFARIVKTPEASRLVRAFIDAQEARKLARQARAITPCN